MALVRVGESGKRYRLGTSFDMSSNTSLGIVFTRGDTTTLSVTAILETSPVNLVVDGASSTAAANESVFYDFEPTDLASGTDGEWDVEFTYINTGPTPDDVFKNLSPVTFTVDP